jgi:hypothetical protein
MECFDEIEQSAWNSTRLFSETERREMNRTELRRRRRTDLSRAREGLLGCSVVGRHTHTHTHTHRERERGVRSQRSEGGRR